MKTAPTGVTERPPGPPLGDTSTKASSAALVPQTAPLPLTQKWRNRWRDRQRILRARARSDGRGLRQTLPLVQLCAARGAPSDVAVGVDGQPRSVPCTVWEPCVARARPAPGRASCPGQARPAARACGILDDWLIPRCAAPKGAAGGQVEHNIPARGTPALSWRSAALSATSSCWPGRLLREHRSGRRWKFVRLCVRADAAAWGHQGAVRGASSMPKAGGWDQTHLQRRALELQRAEALDQLS